VAQALRDALGVGHHGQELEAAVAAVTCQNLDGESAIEKLGPGVIGRRGVLLSAARAGALPGNTRRWDDVGVAHVLHRHQCEPGAENEGHLVALEVGGDLPVEGQ
jgi:hypothetical protein